MGAFIPGLLEDGRGAAAARARCRRARSSADCTAADAPGCAVPPSPEAWSIRRASDSTVGCWNRSTSASRQPHSSSRRRWARTSSSEWPPRSKKLSCSPTDGTPSSSLHSAASRCAVLPCGGGAAGAGARARRGIGQRGPVHLAVGIERQRIQHHDGARHHVAGQPLRERRTQRHGIPRARHVGHQRLGALRAAHHRHRVLHAGLRAQRRFDLAQLDPQAAQLHLVVDAPQVLDLPFGIPAHPVPGAVQAPARSPRIGHEALGPSARAGPGSRAPAAPRRCRARRPRPRGTGCSCASSTRPAFR